MQQELDKNPPAHQLQWGLRGGTKAEAVMKEATAITKPKPYLMLYYIDQQKSHIMCRQNYVVQCPTEEKRRTLTIKT